MTQSLKHSVLRVIKENPGISLREISEILNINTQLARSIIYQLKTQGYVERISKGLVLTEKGEKLLEYLESKPRGEQTKTRGFVIKEETREEIKDIHVSNEKNTETVDTSEIKHPTSGEAPGNVLSILNNLAQRLSELEKRVYHLESVVKSLEQAIIESRGNKSRKTEGFTIDPPVQPYSDAVNKYGSLIEKLITEGKAIRVGSLIVDTDFYKSFCSRFPIKASEVENLGHYEKILLEEMRREALVILYAGREYRLISH